MTTGTQGWHADPALLASYLAGDVDAVTGASVEQHVSRCETCRAAVGRLLEPLLLEQTWTGIRDAVVSFIRTDTAPEANSVAMMRGIPTEATLTPGSYRIAIVIGAARIEREALLFDDVQPDDAEVADILLHQVGDVVVAHEQHVERHVLAVAHQLVLAAAVLEAATREQVERVIGEAAGLLDRDAQALLAFHFNAPAGGGRRGRGDRLSLRQPHPGQDQHGQTQKETPHVRSSGPGRRVPPAGRGPRRRARPRRRSRAGPTTPRRTPRGTG